MNKILLFLLFLLLFRPITTQSQDRTVDSLLRVLTMVKEDTAKVNTLSALTTRLWQTGNFEKAMSYGNNALQLAQKLDLKNYIADINNSIGLIYYDQGKYPEALQNHLTALKIELQIDDKNGSIFSYIDIGNVYFQQDNYTEAIKAYRIALKLGEQINNKRGTSIAYNNMGNVYTQQGNFEESLKSYLLSLKIAKEINYKQGIAFCYNNLANIYEKQGNYQEALNNYMATLTMSEELGDKSSIAGSCINLGNLYTKLGTYSRAKEYLDKSLTISQEIGNREEMVEGYNNLAHLDSLLGDFKQAYQYQLLYSVIKDSILNERSKKQISQLSIQYETEKKDQQIKTQELKNSVLQTRIYYGVVIGLLLLGVVVLLFYFTSKRKKKEYEANVVTLELKVLRTQLNPHFISNAFISIESYIEDNPLTGTSYLRKFSLLMRGVLESSEEKEISLGREMQLIEHYLELEKLRLSGKLNYSITFDESLDRDEIMIPPLITQPAIENAIWHGLSPQNKDRELAIHHAVFENTLIVTIINNAIDNREEGSAKPNRRSFGVKITRERLLLLKQVTGREGTLDLEILPTETTTRIFIPLKEI